MTGDLRTRLRDLGLVTLLLVVLASGYFLGGLLVGGARLWLDNEIVRVVRSVFAPQTSGRPVSPEAPPPAP